LTRILEIEPRHEKALFQRAMVRWELRLLEDVDRDLSTLIEILPDDCYLHFRRAEVRAWLRQHDGARHDRVRCHELGFNLVAFYEDFLKSQANEMGLRNPVRVKKVVIPQLTHLLKLFPEHAGAWELRAQAFEMMGEPAKAARDRKKIRIRTLVPLPDAAPGRKEEGFGKWFWDQMSVDR
jgi:hypothetical protein